MSASIGLADALRLSLPKNEKIPGLVRDRGQQRVAGGNRPLPSQGDFGPAPAQLWQRPHRADFVLAESAVHA